MKYKFFSQTGCEDSLKMGTSPSCHILDRKFDLSQRHYKGETFSLYNHFLGMRHDVGEIEV